MLTLLNCLIYINMFANVRKDKAYLIKRHFFYNSWHHNPVSIHFTIFTAWFRSPPLLNTSDTSWLLQIGLTVEPQLLSILATQIIIVQKLKSEGKHDHSSRYYGVQRNSFTWPADNLSRGGLLDQLHQWALSLGTDSFLTSLFFIFPP